MSVPSQKLADRPPLTETEIFFVLIKRFGKWILLCGLLSAMVAALISFAFLRPEYLSTATIMTRPKTGADSMAGKLAGIMPAGGSPFSKTDHEAIQLQELLNSRFLNARVRQTVEAQLIEKGIPLPAPNRWPSIRVNVVGPVFRLVAVTPHPEFSFFWVSGYLDELQKYLNQMAIDQAKRASEFIGARIGDVKISIDELEARLTRLRTGRQGPDRGRSIESQIVRTQRELFVQEKVVETLSQQLEQAQIDTKRNELAFLTLDPTTLPDSPSGPRHLMNAFIGFVFGVLLSMSLLFVAHRMNLLDVAPRFKKA